MPTPRQWGPYDPVWLVELAREQHPSKAWLHDALARCTRCWPESRAYIYFIKSPWHTTPTGVELHSPTEGWIVLDIIDGNSVAGVEFIDKIEDMPDDP